MTFRKEAQTQLKSLRDSGITLECKLNATNKELHAELQRIELLLVDEALALQEQLVDIWVDDKPMPTTSTIEDGRHSESTDTEKLTSEDYELLILLEAPYCGLEDKPTAAIALLNHTKHTYMLILTLFALLWQLPQRALRDAQAGAEEWSMEHMPETIKALQWAAKALRDSLKPDDHNRIELLERLFCL